MSSIFIYCALISHLAIFLIDALLILTALLYLPITYRALHAFPVNNVGFLLYFPSIESGSTVHVFMVLFAIVALLVVTLGFPLLMAVLLLPLSPPHLDERLYEMYSKPYKETFYFWEIVEVLYRCLLACFYALIKDAMSTLISVMFLLVLYELAHVYLRPIYSDREHWSLFIMNVCAIVCLACGAALNVVADAAAASALNVCVFALILFVVAMLIGNAIYSAILEKKEQEKRGPLLLNSNVV